MTPTGAAITAARASTFANSERGDQVTLGGSIVANPSPTYDWKYLVCGSEDPAWDEFASEHDVIQTTPASSGGFDPASVAELIGERLAFEHDVLILLESPGGKRWEVGLHSEPVRAYGATECREVPW